MLPLSSGSVVARSRGFVEAAIDDEVVILSIEHGTCYGLNRVGSRIWNLLASQARIGDLCATLLTEYRVRSYRLRTRSPRPARGTPRRRLGRNTQGKMIALAVLWRFDSRADELQ